MRVASCCFCLGVMLGLSSISILLSSLPYLVEPGVGQGLKVVWHPATKVIVSCLVVQLSCCGQVLSVLLSCLCVSVCELLCVVSVLSIVCGGLSCQFRCVSVVRRSCCQCGIVAKLSLPMWIVSCQYVVVLCDLSCLVVVCSPCKVLSCGVMLSRVVRMWCGTVVVYVVLCRLSLSVCCLFKALLGSSVLVITDSQGSVDKYMKESGLTRPISLYAV